MSKSVWGLLPPAIQQEIQSAQSVLQQIVVTGLTMDSRLVEHGSVFFAITGHREDGRAYIDQALSSGAVMVISQASDNKLANVVSPQEIAIANLPQWLGEIAGRYYDQPSNQLCLIGVTGTNGKTTVSFLIASLAASLGVKAAVMGTNGYGMIGDLKPQSLTTPNAILVQAQLRELKSAGAELVVMEVSSHALIQGRVNGCVFKTAIFTNLSQDHLDYHQTMDAYALAKQQLFQWDSLSCTIINGDDEYAQQFVNVSKAEKCWIFGCLLNRTIQSPVVEVNSCRLKYEPATSWCQLDFAGEHYEFQSSLLGQFNQFNLTAALIALHDFGLDVSQCLAHLNDAQLPEGRMSVVSVPDHELPLPKVVVDFAHTADAIQQVLSELSVIARTLGGCLRVVFGCGGDRDRGKRPLMASQVQQYAQDIIVTSDNPRSESMDHIFADMASGFSEPVERCDDRALAIRRVIQRTTALDVVAILGKGHEKYQIIQGVKYEFDDASIAIQALREWAQRHHEHVSPDETESTE